MRAFVCMLALVVPLGGCGDDQTPFPSDEELGELRGLLHVRTLPRDTTNQYADSAAAVALGRRLFGDAGLSRCGNIACVTCHLAPSYADAGRFSVGCGGATSRNTPSLLDAGFADWFYWDGRKDSVWAHASLPLTGPAEMAADPDTVRSYLQAYYRTDYRSVFGVEPDSESDIARLLANFGKAIHAYVRTLVRVDAPFDADLQRFIAAADAGAAAHDPAYVGLKTFVRTGRCVICHKGPMLSDGKFHNIGVREDGAPDHGRLMGIDMVLADPLNGSGIYSDDPARGRARMDALASESRVGTDGAFKTPGLRNVALSAPYMHNGTSATLEDTVELYNRGGDPSGTFAGTKADTIVPLGLSGEEKAALVSLLKSLTGTETP